MQEFFTPPFVDRSRWRAVRDRFEEAIEVPEADLGRWLQEHEPDPQVRREVASLVASHSRAGTFLEAPIGDLHDLLNAEPMYAEGQHVGPYIVVRQAGRGGMGRVYQATDSRLGRTVALKALPPDLAQDPSQRERLRREARALAALHHPGICAVYALEEFGGELFMIAEFVEGETLREEIARGPRPSRESVIALAQELSAALASAHAKGVVHRDVKPENVIRARDGHLRVLDFGLARVDVPGGSSTPQVTQQGALIGTPAYMSPEQLKGEQADARTDVFALGVLTYEYATGLHPFAAATALARVGRVLEGEPEPLGRLRPDLPPALLAAVDRCLRKNPSERFVSAGALVTALDPPASSPASMLAAVAAAPSAATGNGLEAWWRRHQLVLIGLYLVATIATWQIKEWQPGIAGALFIAVGIAAVVGGVLRGHLLFTERTQRPALAHERRRVAPATMVIDLTLAAALAGAGLDVASSRAVIAVLVLGLAVGIVLARVLLEPATSRAAFPPE